jgi:uncharacterized protein (DUF58 family)
MVRARTLNEQEVAVTPRHSAAALKLAAVMPRLIIAARRTSASIIHGLHGRRRSGVGENFWQFRRYSPGESAARIDWRRSALGDHLYVREQEWEAAHTVFVWIDRSRSMAFKSDLAGESKLERAIVMTLALADLLVRGGERVGLIGIGPPTASRRAVDILAQQLIAAPPDEDMPAPRPLSQLSEAVMIGDFLEPEQEIATAVRGLAGNGARGHLVTISDPAEETFPFSGRTEFIDPEIMTRFTLGRAQDLREEYAQRLAAHREAVNRIAGPLGWSTALHRTDRPAAEALLSLYTQLTERPNEVRSERLAG